MLNRSRIVAVVGELVAARMAEHVRMRREGQAGESTGSRYDLVDVGPFHRTPALTRKDVHRWTLNAPQLTQRADLSCTDQVIRCRAVLRSRHLQHGLGEIDLIPAQRDQLSGANRTCAPPRRRQAKPLIRDS